MRAGYAHRGPGGPPRGPPRNPPDIPPARGSDLVPAMSSSEISGAAGALYGLDHTNDEPSGNALPSAARVTSLGIGSRGDGVAAARGSWLPANARSPGEGTTG